MLHFYVFIFIFCEIYMMFFTMKKKTLYDII